MSYLKTVYDRNREPKTTYPSKLINYLIKRFNLKRESRLLELGIGNGDFLQEFHKYGFECFGLDREISFEVNRNLKIKKVNLARQKFPFQNNTFDIVYHKSVLEHFYRDEADLIMKESYRVLKKGGKLIILVPDWVSQMKNYFEDYTHVHPYDILAVADLLKMYGFRNVKSDFFYQLPIIWRYPVFKLVSRFISIFMSVHLARKLTEFTKWKFFRWSRELMILGYGEK